MRIMILLMLVLVGCLTCRINAQTNNPCAVPSEICGMGNVVNGKTRKLVKPNYPPEAENSHQAELVKVKVEVGMSGRIIAAKAVSGNALFYAETEKAALISSFSPTIFYGKDIEIEYMISYKFNESREVEEVSTEPLPLDEKIRQEAESEFARQCAEAHFRIRFDGETWKSVEKLRDCQISNKCIFKDKSKIKLALCIWLIDTEMREKLRKVGFEIQKEDTEKHLTYGKIRTEKLLELANLSFVNRIISVKP